MPPDIIPLLFYAFVNGIVWGFIVALISLGLALIMGLMRIINIAHGDLYMVGAVLGWYFLHFCGNFWLAIICTLAIMSVIGLGLERLIIRPFEGNEVSTVIVTIALTYIFEQIALATFGGSPERIENPFPGDFKLLGIGFSSYRVIVAVLSGMILAGFWLLLYKTKFGLWIRASVQDGEMANAMGIPVTQVYMATFALGCGLTAVAGVLAAPIVGVYYLMGERIMIYAFMAVVIGGFGSLKGSVVASLLVSSMEGLSSVFLNPVEARVLTLIFMIIVVLLRPAGLFSSKS